MNSKLTKLFFLALTTGLIAQAKAQTNSQVSNVDLETIRLREKEEADYKKAVEIATAQGKAIKGKNEDGSSFALVGLNDDGSLKYYRTFNNTTPSSINTARVNHIHNGGRLGVNLEGQGMIIGEWDEGAVYAAHNSLGVSRLTNKDGSSEISDHASHVAGTMVGNNNIPAIKGIAPQASLWFNDWYGDSSEMRAQAATGLLVSNHSYGSDYVRLGYHNNPESFGRYGSDAATVDEITFTHKRYLPVFAAGNARNGLPNEAGTAYVYFNTAKGGADLMHGDAVSKNAVVVAAVKGVNNYQTSSDVEMTDFSQWGPTDDFRIKPDISAKGFQVSSVGTSGANAVAVENGTSMAAPSVTAVFALWQQYYKTIFPTREYMYSATVKALMAVSADDAGKYKNAGSNAFQISNPGPNARFGWGLINAERGVEIIRDSKLSSAVGESKVLELTLNPGQTYELEVVTDGTSPLKAGIAWTDPAGNVVGSGTDNSTPVLVNDLDLRIIRPNGVAVLPWALDKNFTSLAATQADNNVDPIEVVEYAGAVTGNATAGTYTIRVTHKGTLKNNQPQQFSLVVHGIRTTTASNEDKLFENLNVYPNPTNDVVNISASYESIEGASVEMFDLLGKKVYSNADLFNSNNSNSIDISNLNKGVYILKLENKEYKQTVKVVKK